MPSGFYALYNYLNNYIGPKYNEYGGFALVRLITNSLAKNTKYFTHFEEF